MADEEILDEIEEESDELDDEELALEDVEDEPTRPLRYDA
jgi:hypothetical protein